ncbi:hypothetical protein AVEN_266917-1 [Araneus ventricosus]|uniref:PiggyBac transposable element-derived protein domain-containing protein n=1 Tax=Araneus ventricosus TaxID=182803 RepID=A0A4Y2DG80_ARAVE|nr:hypothetical protein AVEN_123989-1 [Araneus ventricosus]GBM15026.1 hypothetical protein AVEN_266917-1 [Araneus ventricosus]
MPGKKIAQILWHVKLTRDDLLEYCCLGISFLPQEEIYWSLDKDISVPIVRDSMSRLQYRNMKQNLHLADNSQINNSDNLYRVSQNDCINSAQLDSSLGVHKNCRKKRSCTIHSLREKKEKQSMTSLPVQEKNTLLDISTTVFAYLSRR